MPSWGQNRLTNPFEHHLRRRPPDGALLPCLYVAPDERHTSKFLELATPDRARLGTVPPFVGIGTDRQRADVLRQPFEGWLGVARGDRNKPPMDDTANLLGRLHAAHSLRPHHE